MRMMKLYILIPGQIHDILGEENLKWLKEDFCKKIEPLFGGLQPSLVRKNKITNFGLYFMGKQTSRNSDGQVINYIKALLKEKLGDSVCGNPIIKLNYSLYDPNFNPISDEPEEKVKNDDRGQNGGTGEFDYEKLSLNYEATEPRYTFEQVILSPAVKEKIEEAIGIIQVESKVFDEWGLRSIIPFASSAISFYGPPGTGKSMAAEAIAHKLGKKILRATYADIESKYHGEGPKMVKAIFKAAEREDAILFLDESDSLLSKRLTNVTDGSAQAINSMRSQLLISLEQFKGIVIFATNLVVNYDKAFLSRLINVEFTLPTADEREKIWWNHLKTDTIRVPLTDDVNIREIAEKYDFCGREIKNTVKNACVSVALSGRDQVSQSDFIKACDRTLDEKEKVASATDHTQMNTEGIKAEIKKRITID